MATPNITPGPWQIRSGEYSTHDILGAPDKDGYRTNIATVWNTYGSNDVDLICTSPLLLEAAIKVWEGRGEIFRNPTDIDPYSPFGQALLELRNAIEKATTGAA